jgi:hypothetical protein
MANLLDAGQSLRARESFELKNLSFNETFSMVGAGSSMKLLIFIPLFLSLMAMARGGDTFPNGGGLSEQAIVSSAYQFSYFAEACRLYRQCGDEISEQLTKLAVCKLPSISALRFATAEEVPELGGAAYFRPSEELFYFNREMIYSANKPMRIPEAFGYLTRIYLDACGIENFDASESIALRLARFIDIRTEQVTVGKDDIDLPIARWIRLRSFHSDLLIEGPKDLLRLSCVDDQLESCMLTNHGASSESSFKNLSLARESLEGENTVRFEVVGHFVNSKGGREKFSLKATYVDGQTTEIYLQGRALTLPDSEF